MGSTLLYVEMIIIGLETFIWMCIFLINIVGENILDIIIGIINNFASSLLLIGVLYIIGILMDRFSDVIFHRIEKRYKEKSGLQAKTTILFWKTYDQEKYFDYTRSRIRILRASIINILLITVSFLWYIIKFEKNTYLIIYILVLGTLFVWISCKGYFESLKSYYDKARMLELRKPKTKKR